MKRIFKYSFSLLLGLAVLLPLHAQERVRGPRISYDLASLTLLYFDPVMMRYTASVDHELKQDLYAALELGYQRVKIDEELYRYRSDGYFARIGADVNLLNYDRQVNVYEMMYVGGRYGLSLFSQQAGNITVQDGYWGDFNGGKMEDHGLSAHWFSLVGGMKAEVFRNFFMGWSVYMNIRFYQSGGQGLVPYNIPGFGKGENRVTVTINYTIAYRIPLQRYTPKIRTRKE